MKLFSFCLLSLFTFSNSQISGWNGFSSINQDKPVHGAVINGVPTTSSPWLASIQLDTITGYQHVCGGFLITPTILVTAGHCTHFKDTFGTNVPEKMFRIHFGADRSRPRLIFNVSRVIRYPTYHYNPSYYGDFGDDIALMELQYVSGNLSTLVTVQYQTLQDLPYVPLQDPTTNYTKTTFNLAGWGDVFTGSNQGSKLKQMTTLQWQTPYSCSLAWGSSTDGKGWSINSKDLCAVNPTSSACQGDSGSALYQSNAISKNNYGNTDLVYGIVSWGPIDCNNGKPWVFTRIASYHDWISSVISSWKSSTITTMITSTITSTMTSTITSIPTQDVNTLKSEVLAQGYKCIKSCKDQAYLYVLNNTLPSCLGTSNITCTWFSDSSCSKTTVNSTIYSSLDLKSRKGRRCTLKDLNGKGWCFQVAKGIVC